MQQAMEWPMATTRPDSTKVMRNVGPEKFTAAPPSVALGNSVAASTVCGPGGSRSVMPSGGQGQHGPVAGKPAPQGRDILGSFGPESKPR
jgi:hypothetical protein